MQTNLVPGKATRTNDATILSAINKEARDGGGNTMVIGIRNEAGDIYRIVKAVGLGEFMGIVGVLSEKLKMTDELMQATTMKDGCDAIFS